MTSSTGRARTAQHFARCQVAAVREDPHARVALLDEIYLVPSSADDAASGTPRRAVSSGRWHERSTRYLPYRRAAQAFMGWQVKRGLLAPEGAKHPGSAWWRAVNERLLLDTAEARALMLGAGGEPSSASVAAAVEFIRRPSAQAWYHAHNLSVVSGYLEHRALAEREGRVERFFINLVLMRVLYAHAMVAHPRLALDWLAPIAPPLGDPRLGMTSIFLSLSRVLPDRYPLGEDLASYIRGEHEVGRLLDLGVILPRREALYRWSAAELGLPELRDLFTDDGPTYAWGPQDDLSHGEDASAWLVRPRGLAALALAVVPARQARTQLRN